MRHVLHIITREPDDVVAQVMRAQEASGDYQVRTVDLRQADPDYEDLLRAIFSADSVECW
jgi:hypothetical protein